MSRDPQTAAHLEWIGFVQPVGLVVSVPALLNAQAYINRNVAPVQQRFLSCLERNVDDEPIPRIIDFRQFVCTVLEWQPSDLVEVIASPDPGLKSLEVLLPEYQECLKPTFAVPELRPKEGQSPWQLLIQVLDNGTLFDESSVESKQGWHASPQAKFERLLRETEIPIGLLVNSKQIRLVYAPRGESSGHITFSVSDMISVAGRPILSALYLLLSADSLFLQQQENQRLPAILSDSRRYQNTVSTKLAEQVLAALFELLRGFQAANDQARGALLQSVLQKDPNQVYAGLLTVLMRLVFILYAEDRNLLSNSSVYCEYYSVSRLYERLREDAGRYPDTMDHRYGSWAQLLTLFRMVFEGGSHGDLQIPDRKGHLFDPSIYPFLEGASATEFQVVAIPQVPDGVVFRVLNNLLMLDSERLSYRTLDVEQIGSVYEAIMGFSLEVATGTSIAIKPKKPHGAPATINLEILLRVKPSDRAKKLLELTDQKISGVPARALKDAQSVQDLMAALEMKIARSVTPFAVPRGNIILQPSNERRKSGSHYTPRSLTEPIVKTTLKPIVEALGPNPTPEQILDIKVCDPAMGSGAFLVESCRQLGDELVRAWNFHDSIPIIPVDEDEILHARRLVAQRCVYGVDRNPMAVNLAKLSLWLATLAKEHPFTFLDHTLRCGDSVVGLSKDHIIRYHWQPTGQRAIDETRIKKSVQAATKFRKEILDNPDKFLYPLLQVKLQDADKALEPVRMVGDSIVAAFFSGDKERSRSDTRNNQLALVSVALDDIKGETSATKSLTDAIIALRSGSFPIEPFHWEIEFPEVFDRDNGGFDAIVGNPPFAGKNTLIAGNRKGYLDWLKALHKESHGNSDLVAHFYRRAFALLRSNGAFGLIATNTIGQGDTRSTGLRWICTNGGTIYSARKRVRWPGDAAVVVSVAHVYRGHLEAPFLLDGRSVPAITAYLYHAGGNDDAKQLKVNEGKSYQGSILLGMGFTFDDTDQSGTANTLAEMERLIAKDPRNAERIFPYLGGEELLNSPTQSHHRYAINLSPFTEDRAREWPDLMQIIEERVKPERMELNDTADGRRLKEYWWQWCRDRPGLHEAIKDLSRVLVLSRHGQQGAFAFVKTGPVFAESTVVFTFDSYSAFALLQSRIHEVWARFFSSSIKDDMRYGPSDCFETFPFPIGFEENEALNVAGQEYYEFRQQLMTQNNEGLTKTYNRFHDPNNTSAPIMQLRELHQKMDKAVLDAYGWGDIMPACDFFLDYDDEEDDEVAPTRRTRRKPWRWAWSDAVKDEVFARLLELNIRRGNEENLLGPSSSSPKTTRKKRSSKPKKQTPTADTSDEDEADKQLTLLQIE
jgi:hypothetical protein